MKTFIGGGKATKYGVKVTIDVAEAGKFIYEYNGKRYLTFDVDPRREPDKYGKTHNVSVWTPDEQKPEPKPAPVEVEKKPYSDDDIPF